MVQASQSPAICRISLTHPRRHHRFILPWRCPAGQLLTKRPAAMTNALAAPRSSSACRRDGPSKTRVGLLRRRAGPAEDKNRFQTLASGRSRAGSTMTMTRLSAWIGGVLVVTVRIGRALPWRKRAATDMAGAGHPAKRVGRRRRSRRRESSCATARFKTTEAAEAAGYKRVTDCVEHQPAGAMGYTSRTTRCSTRRSTSTIRRCWSTRRSRTAGSS